MRRKLTSRARARCFTSFSMTFPEMACDKTPSLRAAISSNIVEFFCKSLQVSESNILVMAETIDDEYLVKQFIQGDKSAFETIFKRHSADVAVLANRLLGWPGDIEDIVQDVFLSAFMSLKKFRCECSLKTWLFTITINKCRSYRYKRLLRLKIFSQAAAETPFAQYQSGDKSSMDFETFDHVRQAVKALPVKCRESIVLKYLQELSTDKICGILGISNNALQVRLHRARQLLKQHLAELMEKD